MTSLRVTLRVGEIVCATVRRKLSTHRVLISLKGHALVAEPERETIPGDEIQVQVLSTVPRIRLRVIPDHAAALPSARTALPRQLRT